MFCFVLFSFVFLCLSDLPADLFYIEAGVSAPCVGDLHLHTELSAERAADDLHHVVLWTEVLERPLL